MKTKKKVVLLEIKIPIIGKYIYKYIKISKIDIPIIPIIILFIILLYLFL